MLGVFLCEFKENGDLLANEFQIKSQENTKIKNNEEKEMRKKENVEFMREYLMAQNEHLFLSDCNTHLSINSIYLDGCVSLPIFYYSLFISSFFSQMELLYSSSKTIFHCLKIS